MDGAFAVGGLQLPRLGARTQVRIELLAVFLTALIDTLVSIQAKRWFLQSKSYPALKWMRRFGLFLLLCELAHVVLLARKLDDLIARFAGVRTSAPLLGPSNLDQWLELAARYILLLIGAPVQTCFTWRGYKITKKAWTRLMLAFFWAASGLVTAATLGLMTVSLVEHGTIFSLPAQIGSVAFAGLCLGQNVALAWLFYNELIADRRKLHERDAVTEFAIQALSHQAPLIIITFGAVVAAGRFSFLGLSISGLFVQLYSPVCLLSGLTALLSHDEFRQRVHQSDEVGSTNGGKSWASSGVRRVPRRTTDHRKTQDDPSLWRADMSHISQPESAVFAHVHLGHVTPYNVDRVEERQLRQTFADDYFNFDMTALERARPAVTRPSVRFPQQAGPRAAQ